MKQLTFALLATAFIFPLSASSAYGTQVVNEEGHLLYVHVPEVTQGDDSLEREPIFKGYLRDDLALTERTFSVSMPNTKFSRTWKKEFSPRWAGVGIGLNQFTNSSLNINHIDGVSLSTGRSLEFTFNFFERSIPFTRNIGVVTGLGTRWNRYHLSENDFFQKVDGRVVLSPAEYGVVFTSTRLGINSFTVPLLFEWQSKDRKGLFVSAGVVAVANYSSNSKVSYVDASGATQRTTVASDMFVRPFTFDFLVQVGFGNVGLYARASPITLFEGNRGPVVRPISFGAMLFF